MSTEKIPKTGEHTAVPDPDARPSFFWSQDLGVLAGALVLLVGGYLAQAALTRPKMTTFDHQGLSFRQPKGWLPSGDDAEALPTHIWYQSIEEPLTRLEVRITRKPALSGPIDPALGLVRGQAYGDLYQKLDRSTVVLGERRWERTRFSYAFKPDENGAPALASAVEYAIVNGERLYVVTLHGTEERLRELEPQILRTLAVK